MIDCGALETVASADKNVGPKVLEVIDDSRYMSYILQYDTLLALAMEMLLSGSEKCLEFGECSNSL